MNITTFSGNFSLMNEMHTCFDGRSEHCYFIPAKDLKSPTFPDADEFEIQTNSTPNEYEKVTDFFHFSFDYKHPNEWGVAIDALTREFHCLVTFDGWWDVYVPAQYVKQLNLISNLW